MGFRDRDRTPGPPADGVTRVAIIGDSFPTGVAVTDDHHISHLLEDALADVLGVGRVEVWNLGVPHFGTQQSMLQLFKRWEEIQPRIVVLSFFEGNDPFDDGQGPSFHRVVDRRMTRAGWAPWAGDPFNAERAHLNRPLFAHHIPGDGILQRRSYLYRLVMRGIHAVRYNISDTWPWGMEPFDYEAFGGVAWLYLNPPPPPILTGWSITARVLADGKKSIEERGARFAVMTVPAKITVHDEDLAIIAEEGWEMGYRDGGGSLDGARLLDIGLPGRRIVKLTNELDIPLVNLLQPLREAAGEERLYYRDDSHWTAAGHRVGAHELGLGLSDLGWIPQVGAVALRGALERAVPVGSAHDEFEGGFRPELRHETDDRDDDDDRRGGKGGKGESEIPARLVDPSRLLPLLPPAPEGWQTPGEVEVAKTPLKYPREDVMVSRAVRLYIAPDGTRIELSAYDSGGQPEVDQWWRGQRDRLLLGPVPEGMLATTARIGVMVSAGGEELLGHVDRQQIAGLEAELRPTEKRLVHPTLTVGPPGAGPPPGLKAHLVDPADLVATLPDAPEGWEILDAMPMYRPHGPHDGNQALPARVEALFEEFEGLRNEDDPAWTAQVKQWYRGPHGSFALVVQDTGWNEELLRAREGRMVAVWAGVRSDRKGHSQGLTLEPWAGGGVRGFRTCMPSQGLCKVVGALVAEDDPEAPLARYNVILMGPPGASDEAYADLVRGIKQDRLP
jgi:hypothetical protein